MDTKKKYPNKKSDMYRVAYEQSLNERNILLADVDSIRSLVLKITTIGLVGILAVLQFGLRIDSAKYFSLNLWWTGLSLGLFALVGQWICVIYAIWTRTFLSPRSSAQNIIEQDIEGADGRTRQVKNLSEFYRRMAISQESLNDSDERIVGRMLKARSIILVLISIEYVGVVLAFVGASSYA